MSFHTLSLLLLIGFAQCIYRHSHSNKCFARDDKNFYPYFSTKTVYDIARGNIVRSVHNNCKPVQLWMLARHGTRYPDESTIKRMIKFVATRDAIIQNHKNGAGHLCPTVLKDLSDWHHDPELKIEFAKKLSPQGKRDLYELAKRLQRAFPELLNVDWKHVRPHDFIFRPTNTERTQSSLRSFAEGIFQTVENVVPAIKPPAANNDTLLLPSGSCPAWEQQYWHDHYDVESNKFAAGPEVEKLLVNVNQRLGFNRSLNYENVRTIYDLCRFETAWHPLRNKSSIWCSLLDNDELKILEYQEDLDHYYYCGPGRQWNFKLGCQPLRDMFDRFKEIVHGSSEESHAKGVFYFAHTITLETFMASLGIDGGSSKPLLAENYSTSRDRKYRTSLLGAFATNVVAVLHKCKESTSPYSVSFYTAEKLEKIRGCHDNGLCDWDFIERKYAENIRNECSMSFC